MKKKFNFYVIPDLHMIDPDLNLTKEERLDQRLIMETPAIHKAVFEKLREDKDTSVILVPGDLTNSGELEAHHALVKELEELENDGKRVYVITAAHDYCQKTRFAGSTPTPRELLPELYHQFMHDKSENIAPDGHSYSAQIEKGLFLLALNDDKKPEIGVKGQGFSQDVFEWIKAECQKAKQRGDVIIAMTHHPLLPPNSLYPCIALGDMVENWQSTASFLADCGVEMIFTGHTHMHNIAEFVSEKGNQIYDVNTASVIAYPSFYRKVCIDETAIHVRSLSIDSYDWDLEGLSVDAYARRNFYRLLRNTVDTGSRRFRSTVGLSEETAQKLHILLDLAGKLLNRLTVGTTGKLLGIQKYVHPSIKSTLLRDLLLNLVLDMYRGNESHTPDTPVYIFINAALEKVEKIAILIKKEEICSVTKNMRAGFLYDLAPADDNADLPRTKA